ncbi:hypothetical protein AYI69_g882 [Smittium culicis]|uniref:Uncharacterized protein n=1 Tax=Smittium culicis TaxID=133412 RepID=A0A1R1YRU9_9FUNG|nr:hypothetical protein AYI69_g882 [Smittium culicis]
MLNKNQPGSLNGYQLFVFILHYWNIYHPMDSEHSGIWFQDFLYDSSLSIIRYAWISSHYSFLLTANVISLAFGSLISPE